MKLLEMLIQVSTHKMLLEESQVRCKNFPSKVVYVAWLLFYYFSRRMGRRTNDISNRSVQWLRAATRIGSSLTLPHPPPPPLKGYATRSIQTFREHQGFDPWTVAIAYELLYWVQSPRSYHIFRFHCYLKICFSIAIINVYKICKSSILFLARYLSSMPFCLILFLCYPVALLHIVGH